MRMELDFSFLPPRTEVYGLTCRFLFFPSLGMARAGLFQFLSPDFVPFTRVVLLFPL